MIVCRTPFRISFFGGGTDYPSWYKEHSGMVLSSTINKYSYLTVRSLPPFFDYQYRVRYFQQEFAASIDDIQHPAVKECIKYLNVENGLEIVHNADLPAQSGLGSSSTFTVGLLHALHTLQHKMPAKRELALQAIEVEQDRIGEAVGSQDQTAAAFGGFNIIRFGPGSPSNIDVSPLIIPDQKLQDLQEHLLLCFTGFARTASTVAKVQIEATPSKEAELNRMYQLCEDAVSLLLSKDATLHSFGELLNEQWSVKRSLTDIVTNSKIDEIYEMGLRNGATGGKLLGAGGGGVHAIFCSKI
jgi:D-glycero-alpha-D-manno-heptose-7-phosphate kinase